MTAVSILTAAHNINPKYLHDAYNSLLEQDIEWEWIIQLDSSVFDENIPATIRKDSRVDIHVNGSHLGASATRNLGLLACNNLLIQNLDADDTFYPDAIPALAEAIDQPKVAFAFGESHLTYKDGTTRQWQPAPWEAGVLEPGIIVDWWLQTGRHHVSLSATMWKAIYLHAYGGWSAQTTLEDASPMLAIADDYCSSYISVPTTHYRVHGGQSTQQNELTRVRASLNHRLVANRVIARRALSSTTQQTRVYFDPNIDKFVYL